MKEDAKRFDNTKRKNPNHGQNIKWFRKKIDYSQEYLAILVGEKQQTISEWEKCEYLDENILERVAKALEIGVIWLRDIVTDSKGSQVYVENLGTNFIETEHVAYAIHNPLEAMEETHKNNISIIRQIFEETIESLRELLHAEKEEKKMILDRFLSDPFKTYSSIEENPILNEPAIKYTTTNQVMDS